MQHPHDAGPLAALPRNLIVFMGDGMGAEQVAAGRFAAGGELALDALAGPALAVTDSLTTLLIGGDNPPATDSAAAATWIATGVQVANDVISVAPDGSPLETVLERGKLAGKATGLVTTAAFFDASPAAFSAHRASRGLYPEIARDMLGVTQVDVVMGAGDWLFDDPQQELGPLAADGGYAVVRDQTELAAWDATGSGRLLGLFNTDFDPAFALAEAFTMTPALERNDATADPPLLTMTQRALDRLGQNPEGFFLFAEDEITDEIGHNGPSGVEWANRALPAEVMALDAAVAYAVDWTREHSSFDETLIVVLADHETGGYRFDRALGPSSGEFVGQASGIGYHTRAPIEVYALGPGSAHIARIHDHGDTYKLLTGALR
jgi:alkaline phosphatase